MLEVAEQANQQNVDIKNIFLALGSGCTTAGILLGIVLARKFDINALPNIKVRSVIIHHVYANVCLYCSFVLFFLFSNFLLLTFSFHMNVDDDKFILENAL